MSEQKGNINISRQGEKMPNDEIKYNVWIKGKLAEGVAKNDYSGVNPNALNGLRDDLRFYCYSGLVPSQEVTSFVGWVLEGAKSLFSTEKDEKMSVEEMRNKRNFIIEAENIIVRTKRQK